MSTAGGRASNTYGGSELYMHSDMQDISNEVRITNMIDKAIILELEYRRGVNISRFTERREQLDRGRDYGQDR